VVKEAQDSGVWVFGGGLHSYEEVSVVATDGTVTDGPYPESKAYIGGFSVVDVPSPPCRRTRTHPLSGDRSERGSLADLVLACSSVLSLERSRG
jgi:hypothetical protein